MIWEESLLQQPCRQNGKLQGDQQQLGKLQPKLQQEKQLQKNLQAEKQEKDKIIFLIFLFINLIFRVRQDVGNN